MAGGPAGDLRGKILAQVDLKHQAVHVPEWGETVHVWEMNAHDRDKFEETLAEDQTTNMRARMAVATVRDESGRPLFGADDIPALARLSGRALGRIFKVAARLNGMRAEDMKAEVMALEKNSDAVPSVSTPSGSPNGLA